ncbi:MAG: LicD family protein, partial [Selenomonadaceae bacterium]|nr:LicD family protein [Selenomonadaceae bacterium]
MELREGFLEEEMIAGYRVDWEVKRIWAVNMELLAAFQEICNAHGIKFFIGFGTLLGAVRYQGFVPWDDDTDILMPRKDFERLGSLAGEIPSPYVLLSSEIEPTFWHRGMMKFCHDGTSCIVWNDRLKSFCQGIALEILPMDAVPEDEELRMEQFRKNAVLQKLLWMR